MNPEVAYNAFMYALANSLKDLPIVSLQTGETVAQLAAPLIDSDRLEILAYRCYNLQHDLTLILMSPVSRDLAPDCFIIDSEEELTGTDEVVRLQPILTANFTPLEKPVVTDMGRRLGTVENYTINMDTSRLQKLYVKQSILKSWRGASLIIDREQILDVTPKQFVVREASAEAPLMATGPIREP